MTRERIVVAMSGGVDSSVAAAILKEDGYQVIGITMKVWPSDNQAGGADRFGGCCGLSAAEDASKVAYQLGIPHYAINLETSSTKRSSPNFAMSIVWAGHRTRVLAAIST